jgi:hypothetical protein
VATEDATSLPPLPETMEIDDISGGDDPILEDSADEPT